MVFGERGRRRRCGSIDDVPMLWCKMINGDIFQHSSSNEKWGCFVSRPILLIPSSSRNKTPPALCSLYQRTIESVPHSLVYQSTLPCHRHGNHCPLSGNILCSVLSNKVPVFILSIRTLKIYKLNSPPLHQEKNC